MFSNRAGGATYILCVQYDFFENNNYTMWVKVDTYNIYKKHGVIIMNLISTVFSLTKEEMKWMCN